MDEWNKVAQCESGGDWTINYSSDGLSVGGLQFQNPSWQSALEYLNEQGYDTSSWTQTLYQNMPKSQVPTKDQTILAGEALLHLQGRSAWVCDTLQGGVLSASMFDGGANPWGLSGTNVPADLGGSGGGSTSTPPPASTGTGKESAAADAAIAYAKTKLGDPYVWGGTGPDGFDCSGLVYASYVYGAGQSSSFPRDTLAEYDALPHISDGSTIPDDILPGDLILMYFDGTSQPDYVANHVTMYIGNGQQIEASGSHGGVAITNVAGRGGRVVAVVRPTPADSTGGNTGGSNTGGSTTPPPVTPPTTPAPVHHHKYRHHHRHASTGGRTHVVQPGDTLWDLAVQTYGDGTQYHKIFDASNLRSGDPHWIYPGEVVNLPE
jgi:cell wall-associated NlpC family hydrolase